jgi:hypothetical protein
MLRAKWSARYSKSWNKKSAITIAGKNIVVASVRAHRLSWKHGCALQPNEVIMHQSGRYPSSAATAARVTSGGG